MTMGPAEIRRMLPHRYPMLLVDRVLEVVPGAWLTAQKAVSQNEPWYRALSADAAEAEFAYPPVLLIESWGQAAGLLALSGAGDQGALGDQVMLFGGMTDVVFHDDVRPGDVVEHQVRLVRTLQDASFFEGESTVDGRRVLEVGRIVMAMRPAAALSGPAIAGTGAGVTGR